MDNPVHEARPVLIDSWGLWSAFARLRENLTLSSLKIDRFRRSPASLAVLQSFTNGENRSKKSFRQGSRLSLTLAYGSTSLRKISLGI